MPDYQAAYLWLGIQPQINWLQVQIQFGMVLSLILRSFIPVV